MAHRSMICLKFVQFRPKMPDLRAISTSLFKGANAWMVIRVGSG